METALKEAYRLVYEARSRLMLDHTLMRSKTVNEQVVKLGKVAKLLRQAIQPEPGDSA